MSRFQHSVVFAGDKGFALPLIVAVASVLQSASEPLRITILDLGIPARVKTHLGELLRKRWVTSAIHWEPIDRELFEGFSFKLPHVTLATFARLFAVRLLGTNIKHCLYLDSDILCGADVVELVGTRDGSATIGAVRDFQIASLGRPGGIGYCLAGENLRAGDPFFNAGVLHIDCAAWRTRNVEAACLSFLSKWRTEVQSDQDVLNAVLHDQWQSIPLKWNYQLCPLQGDGWSEAERTEWGEMVSQKVLNHFVGSMKPWNSGISSPAAHHYWDTLTANQWLPTSWRLQWKSRHLFAAVANSRSFHKLRSSLRFPPNSAC